MFSSKQRQRLIIKSQVKDIKKVRKKSSFTLQLAISELRRELGCLIFRIFDCTPWILNFKSGVLTPLKILNDVEGAKVDIKAIR